MKTDIMVDAESHDGAKLVFGVMSIEPGTEVAKWEANSTTFEAYYLKDGRLRLTWSGAEEGDEEVEAGDGFYFAPGYRYSVQCVGDETASVMWAITPAMPGPAD
jgi:quercetin dioxygenase-like cupin family protein